MIHFGAAGVFGGPPQRKREPEADCFRVGDVWQSPKGTKYLVKRVKGWTVILVCTETGRKIYRSWDAIGAHSNSPWVRLACGPNAVADSRPD